MCQPERRRFLGQLATTGFLLTPLAAALSACSKGDWPEGMVEIKWDRDTCARCNMVIVNHRFAAQLRGGPDQAAFKFDDIGCMVFWLKEKADKYPWLADAGTRFWVADFTSKSREEMRWLDPKSAFYLTKTSPMGYNFAAVSASTPDSLDFNDMRQQTLAKEK